MDTLLIRLVGPQQAWGVQSAGENRDTGLEPSKSGVIGLLCAALGWPRDHPLDDLNTLRMGVRVDHPGHLERDFQTIRIYNQDGKPDPKGSISSRFYLGDAAFLVGLEGERSLLETLQQALASPHWLLFLGRKAFPPSLPVSLSDGLRLGQSLEGALRNYPWLLADFSARGTVPQDQPELWLILEDPQGMEIRRDSPVSFAERRFLTRNVRRERIPNPLSKKEA